MAIQFNCPSCGAMIRVPDTAAGKKGTCPRCNEKLLVPDLATAAGAAGLPPAAVAPHSPPKVELPHLDFQASRPAPARSAVEPQSDGGLPAFGQLPRLDAAAPAAPAEFGLPPLVSSNNVNVSTELKQRARVRKKQVKGAWIIPVVCVLGLIGFLAWFLQKSQPKLEGELTAHTVHDLEVKPGIIPASASGLPADDREEVLRHLRAEPAHWTSTSSKMTLTGTAEGVEVTIKPGTASRFVAVQPAVNAAYLAYVAKHGAELDKPRVASITNNAPNLFAAWQEQFARHEPLTDQKTHRDLVAMPTLVTGVGYHLEAVVNGNLYSCVYEDSDGQVYFLLPNATKSFQLKGRSVSGGSYLPANFHVKIGGAVAAPVAKKKTQKSKAELEQENEGMNPDLYKQNLEELRAERRNKKGKSTGDALKAGLGNMLTDDKPDQPTFKSKSTSKKSPLMMDDDDEAEMNDEMPAKSKPKTGATKVMPNSEPDSEMEQTDEEMSEPPQKKLKRPATPD